jgi:hypothetical protein
MIHELGQCSEDLKQQNTPLRKDLLDIVEEYQYNRRLADKRGDMVDACFEETYQRAEESKTIATCSMLLYI